MPELIDQQLGRGRLGAADPEVERSIRPYSLAVVPALNRVVTTSSDMHEAEVSRVVQVWRLSDLSLVRSFKLPPGPRGRENEEPAEPRLLSDGRTVAVSSFNCGLFLLNGLEGRRPDAEFVHSFPGAADKMKCGLPVVSGRYWIQSDGSLPDLVSIDLSDPRRPVEAGRLILQPGEEPHWISLAPDGERIVISGGLNAARMRVLIARIDCSTGKLSLDQSLRTRGAAEPGISFDRAVWPHGATGPAVPHGAVFTRPGGRGGRRRPAPGSLAEPGAPGRLRQPILRFVSGLPGRDPGPGVIGAKPWIA